MLKITEITSSVQYITLLTHHYNCHSPKYYILNISILEQLQGAQFYSQATVIVALLASPTNTSHVTCSNWNSRFGSRVRC